LKDGELQFSHFHSWGAIQEEIGGTSIARGDFMNFLLREMQKVMNFYSGKWGGMISEILLSAGELNQEIGNLIEKNLGMRPMVFTPKNFQTISPQWFPVLGAAVRGALPRERDEFLTLTTESVQEQYWEARVLSFIHFWRNIAVTTIGFFILLLVSGFFLLSREEQRLLVLNDGNTSPELSRVYELREKSVAFNARVWQASQAKNKRIFWTRFYDRIETLGGSVISLRKIAVNERNVVVTGVTATEAAVFDFKNRLEGDEHISNITLPFENIRESSPGVFTFSLSFALESFEF